MKTIGFVIFSLIFNDFPIWNDENTYSRMLGCQLTPGDKVSRRVFGHAFVFGDLKLPG